MSAIPDNATLALVVTESDFDPKVRAQIEAAASGTVVLGAHEDARRAVFDALPKVIAKRLEQITPADFSVSEIALTINLSGVVFGVGLSGDMTVKFTPKGKERR